MINVKLVDSMGQDLTPVNAARISFGVEKSELDDRDKRLLDYLAKNKHMSPFEHCTLTFIVECPLYIRSQIHRHRTFAYNEISRRYTSRDMEFYIPSRGDFRMQSTDNKQASEGSIGDNEIGAEGIMKKSHEEALRAYETLIDMGLSREQARGVLPQNLMTSFYMTGNLRNFTHFLNLRLDNHAQKEVREVAEQMAEHIKEIFPNSYEVLMKYINEEAPKDRLTYVKCPPEPKLRRIIAAFNHLINEIRY